VEVGWESKYEVSSPEESDQQDAEDVEHKLVAESKKDGTLDTLVLYGYKEEKNWICQGGDGTNYPYRYRCVTRYDVTACRCVTCCWKRKGPSGFLFGFCVFGVFSI
jgi:hypothetical protein